MDLYQNLFHTPELPYAARKLINRLFFRSLAGYLVLDTVVFLFFSGVGKAWWLLLAAEVVALLLGMQKNTQIVQQMFAPIRALEETADALNGERVDTDTLRRLAKRLDGINVDSLKTSRIPIPGGQEELRALASAINAMLERIDREYQVQARFVSDASHELRTPIAVIQGYANMLDRWGKDDPAVRQEAISAIRAEADSMATLVEQLLFLARGDNNTQTVHFKAFDLSAVVDEVYRETELLETGRQVGSAIQPGIRFYGDTGLLKQALRILLDRLQGKEGIVQLSVSDTGQGIAPDDLPKVFQRFYRTDESRTRQTGGTGLGLSIAQWIAARHGGWIQVSSKQGLGSRFTLVLPWVEQPAEEIEETA